MTVLALDLATTLGYAIERADGRVESGVEKFAPKKREGEGMRWVRFRHWLGEIKRQHEPAEIVYEHVVGHGPGAQAGHIYGGFLAHLQAFCEHHQIPYRGLHVATVKKHWTGKGNAKKDDMIAEARKRGFNPKDHNEADAIAVLHAARKK